MKEIVVNKIQSIQRCIDRARYEYSSDPDGFDTNYTRQDAAVLNLLRACELAIDLANHVIKTHKMGIPKSSAESFELLERGRVIDRTLEEKLKQMVKFRNTIIHQYQRMDIRIVISVIASDLDDLVRFGDRVMAFMFGTAS